MLLRLAVSSGAALLRLGFHRALWQLTERRAASHRVKGGTTPQTGVLHFVLSDWLGTKRVQTAYDGTTENNWTNLPFGDGLAPNCSSCNGGDSSEHHFTGKERDAESGLDYFGARMYGSSMGRFISPDDPFMGQDEKDPQSWNMYSYVRNNPLINVDPDGHDCVVQTRTSSTTEDVLCDANAERTQLRWK
jgi:RHS repeat-associated protein